MGYNTVHVNSSSYIEGINLADMKPFKYRVIDKITASKMNIVDGIKLDQCAVVIAIDGRCDVGVGDNVLIMGKKYKVTEVGNDMTQLPLKFRKDYEDVPGGSVLTLA